MLRGNVLPFIDREVGDINQVQGRRKDEILHPGQLAAVALRDAHEFVRLGVVGIHALGEEGVDPDRIERQRRGGRQAIRSRTIDAGGSPHHARKLFERQRCSAILAPRATLGQSLIDGRSAHGVGSQKDDFGTVLHFGPGHRGLPGRRGASARRQQQRGTGKQFRFHSLAFFRFPAKIMHAKHNSKFIRTHSSTKRSRRRSPHGNSGPKARFRKTPPEARDFFVTLPA